MRLLYFLWLSITATYKNIKDSSVNMATRLRAGQPKTRGMIPGLDKRFFFSPKRPYRPASYTMGIEAVSPGV
jgi:hypothetical protein